jgi:hypothetical protein
MDFNNFNSLSEKRRSWSAEVPLKNPVVQGGEQDLGESTQRKKTYLRRP